MNPIWLTIEIILIAVMIGFFILIRLSYGDAGGIRLTATVLVWLVFSGFTMISSSSVNGEGYSTGTIVNYGNDGWSWNNRVVYLLHDGELDSESFGIEQHNDQLWNQVAQAQEGKLRVKVHYHSSYICWAWNQADCTVIDSIEVIR